jgi:hypothetical protein
MPDTLITPPIRTPLISSNGDDTAGTAPDSRSVTRTTRDWWLYWNRLGNQANSNAKLVTQGTHADRPGAADSPDGALYVESDRGAIYQAQNGVWQYLAGTMWGTLSPDQRPADLGVNDAGFQFRTVDSDPLYTAREFLWSQSEWIEITPVLYGTHAARPAGVSAPARCLYVETDRGNVIYQNQNGTWHYLAGTMFGTLSPDQRPADLGVNDAGFDFRTSVAPPRQFIWSQTAWIETTPVTGAINLTHPNVVTKVDTTAGQIVEGGITDESAANTDRLHITVGGNVGIGVPDPFSKCEVSGRFTASANSEPYSIGLRYNRASTLAYIGATAAGVVQISNAGGVALMTFDQNGRVSIPNLPSSNPGVGTKQLWYDPADGNRVKFAP